MWDCCLFPLNFAHGVVIFLTAAIIMLIIFPNFLADTGPQPAASSSGSSSTTASACPPSPVVGNKRSTSVAGSPAKTDSPGGSPAKPENSEGMWHARCAIVHCRPITALTVFSAGPAAEPPVVRRRRRRRKDSSNQLPTPTPAEPANKSSVPSGFSEAHLGAEAVGLRRDLHEVLRAAEENRVDSSGKRTSILEVLVPTNFDERGDNKTIATSTNELSRKKEQARREGTKDLRETWFNCAFLRHKEHFRFGRQCRCSEAQADESTGCAAANEDDSARNQAAQDGGAKGLEDGGGGGLCTEPTAIDASDDDSKPPSSAEPAVVWEGLNDKECAQRLRAIIKEIQTRKYQSECIQMDDLFRDADADAGPAAGADGGGAVCADEVPTDEAEQAAWVEEFAADFVDNMPDDLMAELEKIAGQAEATPIGPDQVRRLVKALTKPKKEPLRVPRNERSAGWVVPDRQRKRSGKARRPVIAEPRVKLSENNKEDLRCIAAVMVDEMIPQIRRLVASDSRIDRLSVGKSEAFKKRLIDDFKSRLRDKRKCEINALIAAKKLSFDAVSIKAFASVRSILVGMGLGFALPSSRAIKAAGEKIQALAKEDLHVYATPDGWWVSPRASIEMALLRMQQTAVHDNSYKQVSGRSDGYAGPEHLRWQDMYHIKITFDARRITKKTSQTEVMMHIFRKGEEGPENCQNALCIITLGVWMGKDSRLNVHANMQKFFAELQVLATDGVLFSEAKETYLGQWEAFEALSADEKARTAGDYSRVELRFWFAADMAAQAAAIGHGCAGHKFCMHCHARQDERHLPYTLVTVAERTNFKAFATEHDMHAKTLFAINTREDPECVQALTLEGMRQTTAMGAVARAQKERDAAALDDGVRRAHARPKHAPVDEGNPDEDVLKLLVGWRGGHKHTCECEQCVIPPGTCVRVIPRFGFVRPSDFLGKHFPLLSAERMPFCALHCLMRVTESLFQQICQAALCSSSKSKLIEVMNAALVGEGIHRCYKQSESGNWEKISFEGHQAKKLLEKDASSGLMRIERVLDAMWPDKSEDNGVEVAYGTGFVSRTAAVWRQWAVVVKLMTERFPKTLRADVVDGEDGFERFGKECRDFIFRLQSMTVEDYSKSYYLHTLLHHAGDFMRALEKEGMCLGMMSNSGAERRHEYGRRAARKALACSGWRNKSEEHKTKPNLLAYLTLVEILTWQYGEDLLSHELARQAAANLKADVEGSDSRMDDAMIKYEGKGKVRKMFFSIQSRRSLLVSGNDTVAAPLPIEAHSRSETEEQPEEEPLLTIDELFGECFAEPYSEPPCFETRGSRFWGEVEVGDSKKKKAYALIGVSELTEENVGLAELRDPERDWELFCHVPVDCMSDASDAGSEIQDDFWTINIKSFDFPDASDESDCDFNPDSHAATHQMVYSKDSEGGDSEGETSGVRDLGPYMLRRSEASIVAAAAAESATATGAMAAADAAGAEPETGVIAEASTILAAAPVHDDGVRRFPGGAEGRGRGKKKK